MQHHEREKHKAMEEKTNEPELQHKSTIPRKVCLHEVSAKPKTYRKKRDWKTRKPQFKYKAHESTCGQKWSFFARSVA